MADRRRRGRPDEPVTREEFEALRGLVQRGAQSARLRRGILGVAGGGAGGDDGYGYALSDQAGFTLLSQSSGVPAAPDPGAALLYARDDSEAADLARLFALDSNGTEFSLMGVTRLGLLKSEGDFGVPELQFTDIPDDFKHLVCFWRARGASALSGFSATVMTMNEDTANYDWCEIFGSAGGSANVASGSLDTSLRVGSAPLGLEGTGADFAHGMIVMSGYGDILSRTCVYTLSGRAVGGGNVRVGFGQWRSQAVVESIELSIAADLMWENSQAVLYGVY